ncbi:MAG TPA: MCP four helix bundle domain-containing protein, partial [Pseudoduganella sp.]
MKNLPIGKRLAAGFGFVLALTALMTMFGIHELQSVAGATAVVMREPLAKERIVGDWYRLIHTSVRRTTAISKSTDMSLGAFFAEETANSSREVNGLQKQVEALLTTQQEKQVFDQIGTARKSYVASRDAIVALKKEGKLDEANDVLVKRFQPDGKAYLAALEELLQLQRQAIDAEAVRIDALFQADRRFLALSGIAVLTLGACCSWWLTRGIVVPLNRAVEIACNVANNDLRSDIEVTSQDETGRLLAALKTMNGGLSRIVAQVRDGTEHMTSASGEIAAGNLDLSARTEQQAAALE